MRRLRCWSTWLPRAIWDGRPGGGSTTTRNKPLPLDFGLETDRLLLRRLTEDDWDRYLALHSDEDVMRFVGGYTDPERIRLRFEKLTGQYERGFGHWAVVERSAGFLLGAVGLLDHDDWTATPYSLEVGWLIGKPYWNQGYATEAGRAAIDFAFEESGTDRLICIVDLRNEPSLRVAEKLGLQLAGNTIWHDRNVSWLELGR